MFQCQAQARALAQQFPCSNFNTPSTFHSSTSTNSHTSIISSISISSLFSITLSHTSTSYWINLIIITIITTSRIKEWDGPLVFHRDQKTSATEVLLDCCLAGHSVGTDC